MPIDERGVGTVEFTVSSVVLVPEYTQTPLFTPENPNPVPIVVPESVTATLIPVNDPASAATVTGTITINTPDITAFDIGAEYVLTIAAPAP